MCVCNFQKKLRIFCIDLVPDKLIALCEIEVGDAYCDVCNMQIKKSKKYLVLLNMCDVWL